ncbi:MAG: RNA polymerase II mediator complex subunit [Thelocarpon impressellum]|nr:MAG: RNA polymerase II mediator complex subunit [Thelocarpon impressellum]
MAPISKIDDLEKNIQEVIQDLYELSVATYAYAGPETTAALSTKIKNLSSHLLPLSQPLTSQHGASPIPIPPEVIEYVEAGRNPDIYTREFVETVQRSGAHLAGKAGAFDAFGRVLAGEIETAKPELEGEVRRVREGVGWGEGR